MNYTEIKGCIHIHFPLKTLEKGVDSLGKAGEVAGIDFLVITSHTPKKHILKYERVFKCSRYYGKTLVIEGEETDDNRKKNHLLIIGENRWCGNKKKTEDVFSEIRNSNTISFVAHPDGFHKLFLFKKEYFWENWEKDGFTGIEIWSMLFDWARYTRIYNLPLRYYGFPYNLKGPTERVLSLWDKLSLKRKVTGIAGLDIHSLPFFFYVVDINRSFRYHNIFKGLRNHLLLKEPLKGNPEDDKRKIMECLREGTFFFSNDALFDSTGFFFGTEDGAKTMGDTVPAGTTLLIKNPVRAKTRIICNGNAIYEEIAEIVRINAEKTGVYRVEAKLNEKPWLFSNHIRVI